LYRNAGQSDHQRWQAVDNVTIGSFVLRGGGPAGKLSLAAAAKNHENAPRAKTIFR